MSNPTLRTPFGQVELRPLTPPADAPEGMRVYELLPELDELLGVPGFGLANPIRLPAPGRAWEPSILFGAPRGVVIH